MENSEELQTIIVAGGRRGKRKPWRRKNVEKGHLTSSNLTSLLRQDPLDLSFWSFLTFLHHGIEKVERHLL